MSASRKWRARAAAAVAITAASVLALSACASSDSPSGSTEPGAADYGDLTVQLSWIKNEEFSGEFMADSKGYYTDAGFSGVTLVPGPSTGVAELVSGSVDVAINDAVSTGAAVANEGAPIKIIGSTFQRNPFTVLSLKDGGNIATPEDLKGKKIGVQDSNRALFDAFLAANDIDAADLTIVPVQYDPAPVMNGEVDGFMAYLVNESITVELAGLETTNLPLADNGMPFVAETFTTTTDAIANDREKLKAFLVAEIKGWTDAIAAPEEAVTLVLDDYGKDLGLDPEKTSIALAATIDLIVSDETVENGLFTVSEDLQKQTITSLEGAGITVAADDLFDLSLLEEVYEENPDLVKYAG